MRLSIVILALIFTPFVDAFAQSFGTDGDFPLLFEDSWALAPGDSLCTAIAPPTGIPDDIVLPTFLDGTLDTSSFPNTFSPDSLWSLLPEATPTPPQIEGEVFVCAHGLDPADLDAAFTDALDGFDLNPSHAARVTIDTDNASLTTVVATRRVEQLVVPVGIETYIPQGLVTVRKAAFFVPDSVNVTYPPVEGAPVHIEMDVLTYRFQARNGYVQDETRDDYHATATGMYDAIGGMTFTIGGNEVTLSTVYRMNLDISVDACDTACKGGSRTAIPHFLFVEPTADGLHLLIDLAYSPLTGSAIRPLAGRFFRPDALPVSSTARAARRDLPPHLTLGGAYPNPVRDAATLNVALDRAVPLRLTVHNLLGQTVAIVHDGPRPAGPHAFTFDASGLPNGVYVWRAVADGQHAAQTLTVVR